MILYNITTQVSDDIEEAWTQWLADEYLPAVMATQLFTHCQFVKMLEVSEDEGSTYALQLYTEDLDHFATFRHHHLSRFQQVEKERWGNKVFSFASLMEVIN